MTTDDQYYLLKSIAARYAGRRYQADELVAEAWLSHKVRTQTDTGRFWQAARWAMLDYIREQERTDPDRWAHHIHTSTLIVDGTEPGIEPPNSIDYADYLARLCRDMTREQRLVVKMKLAGHKWRDVARTIGGVSSQRAYQIWCGARDVMGGVIEQEQP